MILQHGCRLDGIAKTYGLYYGVEEEPIRECAYAPFSSSHGLLERRCYP